jgi:quercetin dioxygenase-like cupin family protein
MFTQHNSADFHPLLPGIQIKTLVYGEKTLLSEFHLAQGSLLPRHAHPQEQTGLLITGRIRLTIGSEAFEAAPGDTWCIPANVEHQAEILQDAVAIEVFAPLREDYLPFYPAGR